MSFILRDAFCYAKDERSRDTSPCKMRLGQKHTFLEMQVRTNWIYTYILI